MEVDGIYGCSLVILLQHSGASRKRGLGRSPSPHVSAYVIETEIDLRKTVFWYSTEDSSSSQFIFGLM
jgi:hypothetical protein